MRLIPLATGLFAVRQPHQKNKGVESSKIAMKPQGYGWTNPSPNPSPTPSPTPRPSEIGIPSNTTDTKINEESKYNNWIFFSLAGGFSSLILIAIIVGFKEELKDVLNQCYINDSATEGQPLETIKEEKDIEMAEVSALQRLPSVPIETLSSGGVTIHQEESIIAVPI